MSRKKGKVKMVKMDLAQVYSAFGGPADTLNLPTGPSGRPREFGRRDREGGDFDRDDRGGREEEPSRADENDRWRSGGGGARSRGGGGSRFGRDSGSRSGGFGGSRFGRDSGGGRDSGSSYGGGRDSFRGGGSRFGGGRDSGSSFGGGRDSSFGGGRDSSFGGGRDSSFGGGRDSSFGGGRDSGFGGGGSRFGGGDARPSHMRITRKAGAPSSKSKEEFPTLGAAAKVPVQKAQRTRMPKMPTQAEQEAVRDPKPDPFGGARPARSDPFGGARPKERAGLEPVSLRRKGYQPPSMRERQPQEAPKPRARMGTHDAPAWVPPEPEPEAKEDTLEDLMQDYRVVTPGLLAEGLGNLDISDPASDTSSQLKRCLAKSLGKSLSLDQLVRSLRAEYKDQQQLNAVLIPTLQTAKKNKGERFLITTALDAQVKICEVITEKTGEALDVYLKEIDLVCLKPVPNFQEKLSKAFAEGKASGDILKIITNAVDATFDLAFLAPLVGKEVMKLVFKDPKAPEAGVIDSFVSLLSRIISTKNAPVDEQVEPSVQVLLAAQNAWFEAGYQKAVLKTLFQKIHGLGIVSTAALTGWREHRDKANGKSKALFQVMSWIAEEEEAVRAAEDEGDEGDEEDEEEEYLQNPNAEFFM